MTTPNLHREPTSGAPATKLSESDRPGQNAMSWSFPAAARPPRLLRASFTLWLIAVAAGLFETTLVVIAATAGEVGSAAQVAVGVGIRLLAFTGLVYLAAQLRQGKNWARIALAVLYGGFGTLSLVIGPPSGSPKADRWPVPWQPRIWGLWCSRPAGLYTWQRSSRR